MYSWRRMDYWPHLVERSQWSQAQPVGQGWNSDPHLTASDMPSRPSQTRKAGGGYSGQQGRVPEHLNHVIFGNLEIAQKAEKLVKC